MNIVIYNYKADSKPLEARFPLAPIQPEFRTFGLNSLRPNLHNLVETVLTSETVVVVANLSELGDTLADIRHHIDLITARGHKVLVYNKDKQFGSVKEFDGFFEDVLGLAPAKPKRSVGRPKRLEPDPLDQKIALLYARGLSSHEIAAELKTTSQATVSRRLRRLGLQRAS